MKTIKNEERYLKRLAAALQEKLLIHGYILPKTRSILDVGCADGSVTLHLARLFPRAEILGIDLNEDFIERGRKQARAEGLANVRFECMYLRDLLAREERYEAVTFVSVLHEFFSYGEGISSVVKAITDAHELLTHEGRVIIRDMIAPAHFKNTRITDMLYTKIAARKDLQSYFESFEKRYGTADNLLALNHFLLKSLYIDNWEHEMEEDYFGVSLEEYQQIFSLLGMWLVDIKTYILPFLRETFEREFKLSKKELDPLVSTSILVAQKK